MSLTRSLLLLLQSRWERFATQTRLRMLPPVPTIAGLVALGLLVPLALDVDARPTELAASLATQRFTRFVRTVEETEYDIGPRGHIYGARPVFFWPENASADRYVFHLYDEDGTVWAADGAVRAPYYRLRPPGRLVPGKTYRYEVRALNEEGRPALWDGGIETQQGKFAVLHPPDELLDLERRLGLELNAADAAHVLAGYYASRHSAYDVIAAYVVSAELADPLFADTLRRDLNGNDAVSRRIAALIGSRGN